MDSQWHTFFKNRSWMRITAVLLLFAFAISAHAAEDEGKTKAESKEISAAEKEALEAKIAAAVAAVEAEPQSSDARYDLADLHGQYADLIGDEARKKESERVFLTGVEIDMQKPSPKAILRDCRGMTFIDYDGTDAWKEQYLRAVFQDGVKEKKPVLAMVYNNTPEEGVKGFGMRESIIFKRLHAQYGSDIYLVAVNLPVDQRKGDEYMGMVNGTTVNDDNPMGIFTDSNVRKQRRLPPFRGPPSIAMYSPFDVTQGETINKNDGKVKLIDVLCGGPNANWRIGKEWLPFCKEWLSNNIYSPNNSWCWRLNNSSSEQKVLYNKE